MDGTIFNPPVTFRALDDGYPLLDEMSKYFPHFPTNGFAVRAAELDAADPTPGNRADAAKLQWVSVAVMTAGDVLARVRGNSSGQGVGLRGGSFHIGNNRSAIHVALNQVRWTEDLAVSGTIDKPAGRTAVVRASLHLAGAANLTGDLTVAWPDGIAGASASIRGTLDGEPVRARTAAP